MLGSFPQVPSARGIALASCQTCLHHHYGEYMSCSATVLRSTGKMEQGTINAAFTKLLCCIMVYYYMYSHRLVNPITHMSTRFAHCMMVDICFGLNRHWLLYQTVQVSNGLAPKYQWWVESILAHVLVWLDIPVPVFETKVSAIANRSEALTDRNTTAEWLHDHWLWIRRALLAPRFGLLPHSSSQYGRPQHELQPLWLLPSLQPPLLVSNRFHAQVCWFGKCSSSHEGGTGDDGWVGEHNVADRCYVQPLNKMVWSSRSALGKGGLMHLIFTLQMTIGAKLQLHAGLQTWGQHWVPCLSSLTPSACLIALVTCQPSINRSQTYGIVTSMHYLSHFCGRHTMIPLFLKGHMSGPLQQGNSGIEYCVQKLGSGKNQGKHGMDN